MSGFTTAMFIGWVVLIVGVFFLGMWLTWRDPKRPERDEHEVAGIG